MKGNFKINSSPHSFSNNSSTLELATNDYNQSKEQLKNDESIQNNQRIRQGKLRTSDISAFLHLIKCSLGSGLMATPYAFSNIGIVFGFIGATISAFICAHCTHILVKCSQHYCVRLKKSEMSYVDTVDTAFRLGAGGRYKHWSPLMRFIANLFMIATMYGVTIVYVILIASTFKKVLENHVDFKMDIRWYALLLTVLLLPIGIIRHMKFLVPFSAMANIFLLVGVSLTVYFCCIDLPSPFSRPMVVDVARWPLFFATVMFGMEGIGTVMPIENAMRYPGHMLGCPGVLNFAMSVVAFLFVTVGSVGYIKYGDDVEGSITLNLPKDTLSEIVKLLVALSMLFSYPLQLTGTIEVVWEGVKENFSEKQQDFGYYVVRGSLILGTVVIGIAVPNLSPVLSLVGAVGYSGLGLFLPTVTETITFWDHTSGFKRSLFLLKNIILLLMWLFATVFGAITSIQEIVKAYHI